jgi:hypothetical protein
MAYLKHMQAVDLSVNDVAFGHLQRLRNGVGRALAPLRSFQLYSQLLALPHHLFDCKVTSGILLAHQALPFRTAVPRGAGIATTFGTKKAPTQLTLIG